MQQPSFQSYEAASEAYVLSMGVVSALGIGIEETRASLFGNSFTPAPSLPTCVETTLRVPVFEIRGISRPDPPEPGGFTMTLLKRALAEALERAGLADDALSSPSLRVGVAIGTTVACQLNDIPFYASLRHSNAADPAAVERYIHGNPAEVILQELRPGDGSGLAVTISNACSSGADAIGIGALWIEQGLCDVVIAGGADELSKVPLDGFHALDVCSPSPCTPFDAARQGLNLGEAAGVVILARRDAPVWKGRSPSFRIVGFGKTADAYHITQPEPTGAGLERAIRAALSHAEIAPENIGFINAHGTGTQANDAVEAVVFARVFGPDVAFMSTKGRTGHTLGAAGAIEAIFTMLMQEAHCAVASYGFQTPWDDMPATPLRFAKTLSETSARFALSTSLAFGGSNTALLFEYLPNQPTDTGCVQKEDNAVFPRIETLVDTTFTASNLPPETLKRVKSAFGLRRADRFTTLAVAGVQLALGDAFPHGISETAGLVTMSGFGPYRTVFQMLDDILDFPEDQILPTSFSHSVHNAAASYLGTLMQLHGPTFALTNFRQPDETALSLARLLLMSGQCDEVLVVLLDEDGILSQYAVEQALLPAECAALHERVRVVWLRRV